MSEKRYKTMKWRNKLLTDMTKEELLDVLQQVLPSFFEEKRDATYIQEKVNENE